MDVTQLDQFLTSNMPDGPFKPYHYFSKEADALTVYFQCDRDYSQRLSDHVTLLLSCETHEIVGCRIKGISGIIEDLPNYIHANHGPAELSILFLPFRGAAVDAVERETLNKLAKRASGMPLQLR